MTKMRALLVFALLTFSLEAMAADGSSASTWVKFYPIFSGLLGVVALLAKRKSLFGDFSHTGWGQFLTTVNVGAAGSVIPLLDSGSFQWPDSLITACSAGIAAFLAQALAEAPAAKDAAKTVLAILFVGSYVSCAGGIPALPPGCLSAATEAVAADAQAALLCFPPGSPNVPPPSVACIDAAAAAIAADAKAVLACGSKTAGTVPEAVATQAVKAAAPRVAAARRAQ